MAGKVLAGRNNAGDDIATVVPLSRRSCGGRRSGIEPGSDRNRFRLLLLLHFGGGGMEEEMVVVERRRRRRCRPHGAIQPFRHLFPHHLLLMDVQCFFLLSSSLRKKRKRGTLTANKQVFHKFNI